MKRRIDGHSSDFTDTDSYDLTWPKHRVDIDTAITLPANIDTDTAVTLPGKRRDGCTQPWPCLENIGVCTDTPITLPGKRWGESLQKELWPYLADIGVDSRGDKFAVKPQQEDTGETQHAAQHRQTVDVRLGKRHTPNKHSGTMDIIMASRLLNFISSLLQNQQRMYLWWSVCTLYLHACHVRVTAGDSGLCCCCCTYVAYFKC